MNMFLKKLSFIGGILTAAVMTGFPAPSNPPVVKSCVLEVEVMPNAELDYAGFLGILYGSRPEWNKPDSLKSYPYMKGKAVITLDCGGAPRETLVFYLHAELRAHEVRSENGPLEFTQDTVFYPSSYSQTASEVRVNANGLTGPQTLTITYGGMFNPNYAGSPSNYMRIDAEGAYLRGYGYTLWFPVFLNARETATKADFEVNIVTPKPFVGVFTGQRLGESIEGDRRVSHWKARGLNLMDVQLAVRPFIVREQNGIYIYHLDNPKSEAAVGDLLDFTSRLKTIYGDHYREIKTTPQIHIAELPNFASGISAENMIGMTSGQWQAFSMENKDDGLKSLVAHELVHAFVQVPTERRDPIAALVVEGFPSYFHLPALAETLGEEWYERRMVSVEEAYLRKKETKKNRRGDPLPPEKPLLSLTFDDIGTYKDTFVLNDRALLFFHYVRRLLGKECFREFTRELCGLSRLTVPLFKGLMTKHLPGHEDDVRIWLESNDFPERFRIQK